MATTAIATRVAADHWRGSCTAGGYNLSLDMYSGHWDGVGLPHQAVVEYISGTISWLNGGGYGTGDIVIQQYNFERDTGQPYPPLEGAYVIRANDYGQVTAFVENGRINGGTTLFSGWWRTLLNEEIIGMQLVTLRGGPDMAKCNILFPWGYRSYWP